VRLDSPADGGSGVRLCLGTLYGGHDHPDRGRREDRDHQAGDGDGRADQVGCHEHRG
jgi:hypothetical protein